ERLLDGEPVGLDAPAGRAHDVSRGNRIGRSHISAVPHSHDEPSLVRRRTPHPGGAHSPASLCGRRYLRRSHTSVPVRGRLCALGASGRSYGMRRSSSRNSYVDRWPLTPAPASLAGTSTAPYAN